MIRKLFSTYLVSPTIKYLAPGGEKSTSKFINPYLGVKKWFIYI